MKFLKTCFLAGLLAVGAQAVPKTQAQRAHERAQLRAAQHEAAMNTDDAKARQRTREHLADQRRTAYKHRHDQDMGDDIERNADEARDNLLDMGKDVRDWFGFPK
jgi:hypothetical protein